jgi:hypothetical protein
MAEALGRITGLPVRCIDFGNCVHAFVVTPENEVIDIHGLTHWADFLAFLISEGCLPKHAAEPGIVEHKALADCEDSILWRDRGYKKPSESAISRARATAIKHPNLADVIAKAREKSLIDGTYAAA